MNEGYVQIFCGSGDGKSSAAVGKGIFYAIEGKQVIIVQFMKGKDIQEAEFFKRLEPEIKLFRFEKMDTCFEELTEQKKTEEITNIRNGLNYAKKVLSTGECDVLILDEALGLIDEGIIGMEEIVSVIEAKSDSEIVFLTGINLPKELEKYVDYVSKIETQERNIK